MLTATELDLLVGILNDHRNHLIEIGGDLHGVGQAVAALTREPAGGDRQFPIQGGPSVPWSVMAPHESQCRANHHQNLEGIAERGGFSPSEAYAVVHGIAYRNITPEFKALWRDFVASLERPAPPPPPCTHVDLLSEIRRTFERLIAECAWRNAKAAAGSDDCPRCERLASLRARIDFALVPR